MGAGRRNPSCGFLTRRLLVPACALLLAAAGPARADRPLDPFAAAGIEARPGAAVPAEAVLRDADGRSLRLGDLLGKRPVILAPVYYNCPNLCGITLAALLDAAAALPWRPGEGFDLVALSIDPREQPADATAARRAALDRLAQPGAGLHFLTGSAEAVAAVTDAIGFRYAWDPELRQYAHEAAIAVLTPDGRVARWLSGLDPRPLDLRLALVEAGQGKLGSAADRALLLCYHYDPKTGRYSGFVQAGLQAGGAATLLGLGGYVVFALLRERRRSRRGGGDAG